MKEKLAKQEILTLLTIYSFTYVYISLKQVVVLSQKYNLTRRDLSLNGVQLKYFFFYWIPPITFFSLWWDLCTAWHGMAWSMILIIVSYTSMQLTLLMIFHLYINSIIVVYFSIQLKTHRLLKLLFSLPSLFSLIFAWFPNIS